MTTPELPLEIERKYVLKAMPPLPRNAVRWRLEQGYLPATGPQFEKLPPDCREGRLRREVDQTGHERRLHTIKTGQGLVRTEIERSLSAAEFDKLWPATEGRRITKTRHRVRDGAFVWEIDQFDDLDLILAEVELTTETTKVTPPGWLSPFIDREVTGDPAFNNYNLAVKRLGARQK